MNNLPKELLALILSYLPCNEIARCGSVCQHWLDVTHSDQTWWRKKNKLLAALPDMARIFEILNESRRLRVETTLKRQRLQAEGTRKSIELFRDGARVLHTFDSHFWAMFVFSVLTDSSDVVTITVDPWARKRYQTPQLLIELFGDEVVEYAMINQRHEMDAVEFYRFIGRMLIHVMDK
jgi:hypothetical protein